jgi:uncharacterized MnhB-related membrane protein
VEPKGGNKKMTYYILAHVVLFVFIYSFSSYALAKMHISDSMILRGALSLSATLLYWAVKVIIN